MSKTTDEETQVLLSLALHVMQKQSRSNTLQMIVFCVLLLSVVAGFYFIHVHTIDDILSTQWEVTETRDQIEIKQHTDGQGSNSMSNVTIDGGE